MSHNRITLVRVDSHLLALKDCTRILSSYEFRNVPGSLVRATHLGTPMLDLGMLAFGKASTAKTGIVTNSNFSLLVDEVIGEFEVEHISNLPEFASRLEGNIASAIVTTKKGKYALLDFDAITRINSKKIENELSNRRWI